MRWSATAAATCVLAACGSSPPPSDTSRALVYVTEDVPAGLDYDGPAAALPSSQVGIVNLLEPLVGYARTSTTDGGVARLDFTRFEGRLAERWSYDPATLTWTFHLREGVRSCAGNVLSADDVLWTFARAKAVSGAAPIGWFLSSVASIEGFTNSVFTDPKARALGSEVRKLDELTVAIRQSAPNALLLPALATFGLLIFDSREAKRHATPDDPWAYRYINNVSAPGFGAYCLDRWVSGSEFVLRANQDYYRGQPSIDRVVIKRIPQSANRFVVVRMGDAHIADRLTPREYLKLREARGVRVSGLNGNESLFVHLNFKTPPFDRPAMRAAIAAALPYEDIVRNGYFGQATPWTGIVPSSYPGFVGGVAPQRDAERARVLLAEAGFPEGRGLEDYPEAMRLAYVAEKESTLGPVAAMVRSALRDVGIPVELDPIPLTQYGDRQLVKKDLGFALNDQEKPVVVDAGYALQLFFTSAQRGGINNMVSYASDSVDADWAAARNGVDPGVRANLIAQAQRQALRDLAWLPVVEYRTQWAHTPALEGLTWHPDNALRFVDLRFSGKAATP
jgi:peptide/nickel transport system substrate-binding protein